MADFKTLREAMVDRQVRPSDVTQHAIIAAMLAIPRERFVPKNKRAVAYADAPLEIGPGRWMLEPRTLAKMLEALEISPEDNILVVGAGMGYATAVAARLGKSVVAVETDADLAAAAEAALADAEIDNAVVLTGPLTEGARQQAPFDVILINGGIEIAPTALYDQLAGGGRLAAVWRDGPIGQAKLVVKTDDEASARSAFDAAAACLPGFERAAAFEFSL